jgi:hypothetical protein
VHAIEVGKLYNPTRTVWPEGPHLRLARQGIEFVLFINRPTSAEVREYRQGPAQWAWVSGKHVGVLCYRFGTEPWSDAPYQAHRETAADRGTPPGNLVHFILVDASTGIVRAQRLLAWSPEFLDAVLADVAAQLAAPLDIQAAAAEMQQFYAHDSATLARDLAKVRTSGERPKRPEPDAHRNRVNASEVIAAQAGIVYKPGARYHRELPAELARWYAYPMDAGHSVFAAPATLIPDGARDGDLSPYLLPLPVLTVERRGWEENARGFLVVDVPYDPVLGVVVEGDDEY